MPLNILYVCREKNYLNYKNIFENNLCNYDAGFFLLSLKIYAKVNLSTFKNIFKQNFTYNYDYAIIDAKLIMDYPLETLMGVFKNKIKSSVSIYISYDRLFDQKDIICFERCLKVDYYFIPNLLKDIGKYGLPHQYEKKICGTFHGIGFINSPYDLKKNTFIPTERNQDYKFNIFYNGTSYGNNTNRFKISNYVKNLKNIDNINVKCYPREMTQIHRLSPIEYLNATRQAKINLVLGGYKNNIAYRFYEVLYLKSFFVVDSSILNYQISDNFEEKESFVFENLEQLNMFINFYLKYDDEREKLLLKLIQNFEKIYNPQQHGKQIISLLNNN